MQLALEDKNVTKAASLSIEAVAEKRDKTKSSRPEALAIQAALADTRHGRESTKDITSRLNVVMRETEKGVLFETRDRDQQGAWLHRSYVMK